jgi:hypothetical protein
LFTVGGQDQGVSGGQRMAEAAAIIRECRRILTASGSTIPAEIMGGHATTEWQRYPEGEVYDRSSHAQYFYHCHRTPGAASGTVEHGHFHLFLRAAGLPAGVAPLVLPELAVANAPVPPPQAAPAKRGERDEVCHLLAIALDPRGEPVRLFTTNRWVTGETWYRAEDVIRMLDQFQVERGGGSPLVNHWLSALVRLFRPDIESLLQQRDAAVMGWRRRRRSNVFEDPGLEILSSLDVNLDEHLATQPAQRPARHPPSRLPRMAEGWGV